MNTTQNNTSEIDDVCDMLNNMNTANNTDSMPTCANCGKEGSDVTNTCNKCKSVKYCNAACKKKHRKKHKKECERRAAELHDERLFEQPPPREDCPICFLRLPHLGTGSVYMSCCGKLVCRGCMFEVQKKDTVGGLCPFCRTPPPRSNKECIKRYNKQIELNDVNAISSVGCFYSDGRMGCPQNYAKALELWHRAAELGHIDAYFNIGMAYQDGEGVEENANKAIHYFELAAMGGNEMARHNLGIHEGVVGNYDRALKHLKIAVEGGDHDSLNRIQELYVCGHATKDDFEISLRSYHAYLDEIRSDQRDEAAAARDDYKYYEFASSAFGSGLVYDHH